MALVTELQRLQDFLHAMQKKKFVCAHDVIFVTYCVYIFFFYWRTTILTVTTVTYIKNGVITLFFWLQSWLQFGYRIRLDCNRFLQMASERQELLCYLFFETTKALPSPCFNQLRRNFLRSLPKKISQQPSEGKRRALCPQRSLNALRVGHGGKGTSLAGGTGCRAAQLESLELLYFIRLRQRQSV